jgi:hypothetical protein
MNITAVATTGMLHAIEFRDRQRSCQRRPPPTRRSRGGADEPICGDRTGQDDVKVEPPLWRGSWPGNAARLSVACTRFGRCQSKVREEAYTETGILSASECVRAGATCPFGLLPRPSASAIAERCAV